MPYTPLAFFNSYVPDTTIEFYYSIDLTASSSRTFEVSDYQISFSIDSGSPIVNSCIGAISGTEPFTYDDGPQEANNMNGNISSITISRRICNSGTAFTIEDKTAKLYKNGVLVAEHTNSSSETPASCPSTTLFEFTAFQSLDFVIYQGDKLRVEWYDTN